MFIRGFTKLATAIVTMTPKQYYDLAHEKDPHIGAEAGALTGALVGARKGAKGKKHKSALIGAGTGALAGLGAGALVGKGLKSYQSHRTNRMIDELKLRSTPARTRVQPED